MTLEQIENKFKECTKLSNINLVQFPILKKDHKVQKQETIDELSKKFGFVPTPIFLVDTMIVMEQKNITKDSTTCDFCAGCGQYTIRLLRYLKNTFNLTDEQILDHLKCRHVFTELQLENCATLIYIYGKDINLFVGDSRNLKYMTNEHGIVFFNDKTKVWEHNTLIDGLLTKETFNTNKQFLSFIFNNYKDSSKIIDFVNKIKSGEIELEKNEEQVEEITVEKVPEVIEQIKAQEEKPKKEKKVVVVIEKEKEPEKPKFVGTTRLKGAKTHKPKNRLKR